MGNVHGKPHVCKVEPITQEDQGQCDDVVSNQLFKVLPGLLQLQQQDNGLLGPVRRFQQVVRLEIRLVLSVREPLEHGRGVEVPDIRPAHDVQTERAEDRKVHGRVDLFHEASDLGLGADPAVDRPRADDPLHQEFAREGQEDGVEGDEGEVLLALAIHDRLTRVARFATVRQEDGAMHRIGRGRVDGIRGQDHQQDHQRRQPCVLQRKVDPASEQGTRFAPFGWRSPGLVCCGPRRTILHSAGNMSQKAKKTTSHEDCSMGIESHLRHVCNLRLGCAPCGHSRDGRGTGITADVRPQVAGLSPYARHVEGEGE